jgi:lysophospholipase L1-like esterase
MKRTLLPLLALTLASAITAQPKTQFNFDLTTISPTALYSETTGFGYEKPATGEPPYYFSVRVPGEGNYRVTVKLGSPDAATTTTIKAELRRLMVERVDTKAGEFVMRSFIVNVRRPGIPGGREVKLKDREKTSEAWAWDDKLTLEFTNTHPRVSSISIEKADQLPTLYIAGDSTSTDQPLEPYNSWGQMITAFFKPEIGVANHGESGESLRGFLGELRWAKVMSVLKQGDYLLIQMGHNDQKEKGEGAGAMTTYKADLKRMVGEARERGATPIVVTSVNRLTFGPDGKITNSLGDYPEAVRQVAAEEHITLIDLNAMSKPFYEALGPVDAHLAFAGKDTTHHDNYGSYELAKCIAQGLQDARSPLAGYLIDLPRFDPAHPDPAASFAIPAEPAVKAETPYGK